MRPEARPSPSLTLLTSLPVASSPAAPAGSDGLRARRVLQLTGVAAAAVGSIALSDLLAWQLANLPIYLASLVALGLSAWAARRGRVDAAVQGLLVTMTAMITLLIWRNGGLRDPALLAYPGLLVFAALLAGRRFFIGLLLFMLVSTGLVTLGNLQGWLVSARPPVGVLTYVDVAAILVATGFSVWVMSADLRQALRRLETEKSRIDYLAHHDALTGLPNRQQLRQRFAQWQQLADRHRGQAAVVCLDLDNFKSVNDALGLALGDALIRAVSERVQGGLGPNDCLSRQGGDEWVLVQGDVGDADEAAAQAIRLLTRLAEPFEVQGLTVQVTGSLGLAMYPADGRDLEDLLKKAGMAMYQAKAAGRNALRFFDAGINATVMEHVQLLAGLRDALAQDQLELHYQPQLALDSQRVIGAEALLRWRHPALGLIPPARFIPVAEQSGLIVELGAWVLQQACRQAQAWRQQGLEGLVISVNVSAIQFRRGDLDRVVANALDASGLPPQHLELEMTESLLLQDSTHFSDLLRRLKALGVRLAIDDFGTGYSNLGYLQRFEVDHLKIDQSFIRRLKDHPADEAIVRAVVQMARSLGLSCTAEGIEDPLALVRLQALGCQQGQGYLWSPALPVGEFLDRVQALGLAAARGTR